MSKRVHSEEGYESSEVEEYELSGLRSATKRIRRDKKDKAHASSEPLEHELGVLETIKKEPGHVNVIGVKTGDGEHQPNIGFAIAQANIYMSAEQHSLHHVIFKAIKAGESDTIEQHYIITSLDVFTTSLSNKSQGKKIDPDIVKWFSDNKCMHLTGFEFLCLQGSDSINENEKYLKIFELVLKKIKNVTTNFDPQFLKDHPPYILNMALIRAIQKNQIKRCKKLIKLGANINCVFPLNLDFRKEYSPLMVALKYQFYEIAKCLLDNGASLYERTQSGFSGDDILISSILEDIPTSEKIPEGAIQIGLNVNKKLTLQPLQHFGRSEWTLLMFAVEFKNSKILEDLIRLDADLNFQTSDGFTALHIALVRDRSTDVDLNILEILLKNNANPLVSGENGRTLLHFVIEKGFTEAAIIIIQHLSKNNVSVDISDKLGRTPLGIAFDKNNNQLIDLLIQSGAQLENDAKLSLEYNNIDMKGLLRLKDKEIKVITHSLSAEINRLKDTVENLTTQHLEHKQKINSLHNLSAKNQQSKSAVEIFDTPKDSIQRINSTSLENPRQSSNTKSASKTPSERLSEKIENLKNRQHTRILTKTNRRDRDLLLKKHSTAELMSIMNERGQHRKMSKVEGEEGVARKLIFPDTPKP